MDISISDIEQAIVSQIAADTLSLPTLPDVALEVKRVAADPNSDMTSLVRVVSTDASVSARMLKVANSPMMRRSENEVTDLKVALTTMGMKYASNLALGVAMAQMFESSNDLINKQLKKTWQTSSEVAGLCQAFCKFGTTLEPSVAMLAGLVHKIGVLPVLTYAEANPALAADEALLLEAMQKLHPMIGTLILRRWAFSDELVNVCEHYLEFEREVDEADYIDVVTVAVLQNHRNDDSFLSSVDTGLVKAYERLNMSPDSEDESVELFGTASDAAWAMG